MTTNFNAFAIYGTTFLQITLAVIYTDQWAVHLEGGPMVADEVADKHGFVNLGMIVKDYYHFQHRKVAKRSIETNDEHHSKLVNEPSVRWAEQQSLKRRVKRDLLSSSTNVMEMNDPEWSKMWYLNRGNGLDMNVQAAWAQGVTGKGVVVTILDDGLEKDHPDIKGNYDPLASYDVNNHDEDPQPRYDFIDSNRHGTRCAGEVAADANNSICAVGVAYEAEVGGVRMLDGDVTDAVEARSLSLNPQHIDIYSASWGPDDNGKTVDGPGELATRAFLEGIQHGRRGLGSIFVWASGNGGKDRDNCNCDGYTNSIWTLSISSATEFGLVPWYSEACSSTLATTYSSGSVGERQVVTTDLRSTCTSMHTGTSASAPLAAGICALALQVNPTLTWRDMQHIVVHTAKPANLRASDWQTNGVGRNVSHSFGYGLMDAAAMVELARNWTTVPSQKVCEARFQLSNKLIPAVSQVTLALKVDCPEINYLEHVQAKISLVGPRRGDIQIYLKSPMGTSSILLDTRPHDDSSVGFHSWPFMTVHNWGESPKGTWILEIHNEGRYEDVKVTDSKLVLYGTKFKNILEEKHQQQGQQLKNVVDTSSVAVGDAEMSLSAATSSSSNVTLCLVTDKSGRCIECISGAVLHDGQCSSRCPDGMFAGTISEVVMNTSLSALVCRLCHYSCKMCKGPTDSECTECHADADLTESSSCRPTNLLYEMNGIQNYGFAMTVAVAILAVVIVVILLYLLCCQNEKKVDGRTYKVLPQKSSSSSSSYFALDIPGLNGNKNIVQTEEFNDDSQEET